MKKHRYSQIDTRRNVVQPLGKSVRNAAILCFAVVLTSCGGGQFEDLQAYVTQVKARPGSRIAPLPEVKSYERYVYDEKDLRDPFKPISRVQAHIGNSTSQIRPNTNRALEVLEQFPLDTLRMVGSMNRGGEKWAIIKTNDGFVYRVKVGNHLGKNFGEIKRITDTQVFITEIVSDGLGGWLQREAGLKMTE